MTHYSPAHKRYILMPGDIRTRKNEMFCLRHSSAFLLAFLLHHLSVLTFLVPHFHLIRITELLLILSSLPSYLLSKANPLFTPRFLLFCWHLISPLFPPTSSLIFSPIFSLIFSPIFSLFFSPIFSPIHSPVQVTEDLEHQVGRNKEFHAEIVNSEKEVSHTYFILNFPVHFKPHLNPL